MSKENPNYLEVTPQAACFLYANTNICSLIPRFHVMLTMDVNPVLLTQALRETLKRYPQFAIGVRKQEDAYGFKVLEEEADVYYEDGIPVTLGTPETKGYLVRVSYQGRYIFMDFHHTLGDGLSFIQVMNTMLYRYFELSGLPIENDGSITTIDSAYCPEESANPYDGIEARENPYHTDEPYEFQAFMPNECAVANNQPNTLVQIRMPFMALRGVAKQYETSPVTFLSPLFSHAFYEVYQDQIPKGQPIITGVPINLRSHRPNKSTQYYITVGKLNYGKQLMEALNVSDLLKAEKQLLDAQVNLDYMLYQAKTAEDGSKTLVDTPINALQRKEIYEKGIKDALHDFTYLLTNMGNIKLPPLMEQYVMEYYPVLPAAMNPFTLAVTSYKGEMVLSVAQRFEDMSVCNKFIELMKRSEIPAYIAKVSKFRTTRYDG